MSYGNHNGLHISRAIIAENIGVTRVSQGAGSLGTASTNNLGGTLEFQSRTPSNEFSGTVAATYGADDTKRGFIRLDSGALTQGGLKGSVSYVYQDADKWKGEGAQRQHQVNAKIVQPLGDGSLTGFLNFSDRRENDYQDMSAEMITRLGNDWDNFAPDWATAIAVANAYVAAGGDDAAAVYPGNIASVDDAYYDASGLRRDWLAGVTLEGSLTQAIKGKITGYYHKNTGMGLWYTPYVATPGGAPISIRTTEYDIERKGVIAGLDIDLGAHKIATGLWYENNDFNQARRYYGLADQASPSQTSLNYPKNPFYTQWEFDYTTKTLQTYLSDSWTITDALTISAGFKGMQVKNEASPIVKGGFAEGKINAEDWFLPQAGVVYRVAEKTEVFGNYTENMRAYASAASTGPFSVTQEGFDAGLTTLKPETSQTWEMGVRTRSGQFQGSVAAYYVNFKNRQISLATGPSIVGSPSVLQNVGDVRSVGVEFAGLYNLTDTLSLFASYAYNHSQYRDDVYNASDVLIAATKGKTVVDSPKHLLKGEIAYDAKAFFGRLGANYTSKRYYNYLNDRSVGGRVLLDGSIGYRLQGFELQLSVTNLLDKEYVSTVGSGGYGNSGDRQTLLTGAPRQWFVTLRKDF
jgi:iron complex outermembrane receptor protein